MPFRNPSKRRSRSTSKQERRSKSVSVSVSVASRNGYKKEQAPPLGSFPTGPIVKKTGTNATTSWTISDSSLEEEEKILAPLLSIEAPPPGGNGPPHHLWCRADDISSIHVGESVSNGMTNYHKRRGRTKNQKHHHHHHHHHHEQRRRTNAAARTGGGHSRERQHKTDSRSFPPVPPPHHDDDNHHHHEEANPDHMNLLLDTIALAEDNDKSSANTGQPTNKEKNNKKGRSCLGNTNKRSNRSRSASKKRVEIHQRHVFLQEEHTNDDHDGDDDHPVGCSFRSHDSDAASEILISFVSNLGLNSAGALVSSAVGLSLLTTSPPPKDKDGWNHPPAKMVRQSLNRHVQVCLDCSSSSSSQQQQQQQQQDNDDGEEENNNNTTTRGDSSKTACTTAATTTTTTNALSLPVDVDDVSFVRTDPQSVTEAALLHIVQGEPIKALENLRVLLDNQRRDRGSTSNQVAEELDIANTKSKLAILSLMTKNKRDAWQYATSALQTHKKAARPVHITLATMELGLVYLGTEQLAQALQCWREALQLACMTLGYDHFQVAVLLGNLGVLHYYMGNYSGSLTALEESLGLQRQILRSNSQCASVEMPLFQMATTMGNLALILARCGNNYDPAISLMEEALAIQESVLPRTDSVKVVSEAYLEMFTQLRDAAEESVVGGGDNNNNNKATSTAAWGVHNDSSNNSILASSNSLNQQPLPIFGDSDGIPRRHDGSKHHNMSSSSRSGSGGGEDDLFYDCILLGSLVNPTTARERIHATVVQSMETAARRHPDVTHFTNDDGVTISSTVLTRKKQSIPVDCDNEKCIDAELHLESINLQALDHINRNEYKDALDLFESALRSHKEKYGDIHHLVGTGLHNCGIVHMLSEQYLQAKLSFQEAVSVRAAALGGTHPDVAASKFKIGMIQLAGGEYEGALSTFMDIIFQLQMNMSTYGFAPEAKMLNNLGVVLFEMGKDLDAFQSFYKAYQIQKGLTKDPNCAPAQRSLASTLSNLGFIYAMQGQFTDSLGAYQEALGMLRKHYPIDHQTVVTVEENIAHVRAYGAVETGDQEHVQSDVFASCVHLEKEGAKRIKYGQSRLSSCLLPPPR